VKDSRLPQVAALIDDARTIIVDIVDEKPYDTASLRDFNSLDAARQFLNSALVYVQSADSSHPGDVA
jgi:hypothetical protein